MVNYEKKFLEIWEKELTFSVQNLSALLNSEDQNILNSLHGEWLEWITKNLTLEQELLSKEEYKVRLGSLFLVDRPKAYKEAYRARTLQIKYIHFLMETQCDDSKNIIDCESLQFLYKKENVAY